MVVKSSGAPSRIAPGTIFEYRIARLRFHQGYFVKRSVDVWPPRIEGDKLAEIDCVAVAFDPQLRRSLEVIECKTTRGGQGEIDRLIWLKGVASLATANWVTFAKPRIADRAREFARTLKVQVLDDAVIASAERGLEIDPDSWIGFHDPILGEGIVKPARAALNSSRELRRVGKYLFGQFWFTSDFVRVKQLRTFFRLLVENRGSISPDALALGIGEATTLLIMTIFSITTWRNQLAEGEFRRFVETELSTGLGDARSLRSLLRQIDDLHREQVRDIHERYQAAGAGRLVIPQRSLEDEILVPPEWVDAFLNLSSRFLSLAHIATEVIQWADLHAASRLGARPEPRFSPNYRDLDAALELVEAFLVRHWNVPSEFFRAVAREPESLGSVPSGSSLVPQSLEPQQAPIEESLLIGSESDLEESLLTTSVSESAGSDVQEPNPIPRIEDSE